MENKLYQKIKKAVINAGHKFFEDDSKNFNLNLVGFRDLEGVNSFNDLFTVSWKYNGIENALVFKCTTDPGIYYLENPMNVDGTAVLPYGQFRGMWKLGKHQGKYEALVQNKMISVVRDWDKDRNINLKHGMDYGMFGINCHRAGFEKTSTYVGKWSAGCQVFADGKDFDVFMSLIKESVELWGNSFSYTLLPINKLK